MTHSPAGVLGACELLPRFGFFPLGLPASLSDDSTLITSSTALLEAAALLPRVLLAMLSRCGPCVIKSGHGPAFDQHQLNKPLA